MMRRRKAANEASDGSSGKLPPGIASLESSSLADDAPLGGKNLDDNNKTTTDEEPQLTTTHAYVIIWCLHIWTAFLDGRGNGGLDLRPFIGPDYYLLLPVLAILLFMYSFGDMRNISMLLPTIVAAHALDMAIRVHRMPVVWDHEFWGLHSELSFVLEFAPALYLLHKTSLYEAESRFLQGAKIQLGILYIAAAFWKLNTGFFDPNTSCGTVLVFEIVACYIAPILDLSPSTLKLVAEAAPWITVLGEAACGIFILLAIWSSRLFYRDFAIVLVVTFHVAIFVLPVNSAGGFSLDCMTRFILFFESYEVSRFWSKICRDAGFRRVASTFAVLVPSLMTYVRFLATAAPPEFGFTAAGLLVVLYGLLIYAQHDGQPPVQMPSQKMSMTVMTCILVSVTYGYVGPLTGLQQMSAPTMYANLRYYGPSNHYLVPTSILGDDILFGGGLVQVVHSTSATLNMKLGYIKSPDVFPEHVLNMIQSVRSPPYSTDLPTELFPMCMTNPHSSAAVMPVYLESNPPGHFFMPFVLPISAVRRSLHEAVQAGEEFTVILSHSNTTEYPIMNDAAPPERQIVIRTGLVCEIVHLSGGVGDCSEDAIAQLLLESHPTGGFMQAIVNKLLVPYPQLVGVQDEICMA